MMKCNMTFEMTYINFINYLDILSDDSIIYNWLAMENHQKGGSYLSRFDSQQTLYII